MHIIISNYFDLRPHKLFLTLESVTANGILSTLKKLKTTQKSKKEDGFPIQNENQESHSYEIKAHNSSINTYFRYKLQLHCPYKISADSNSPNNKKKASNFANYKFPFFLQNEANEQSRKKKKKKKKPRK